MSVVALETLEKQPSESIKYAIDFTNLLKSGETLSTLTSVLEVGTSGLTLSEKAINTAAITKRSGQEIAIGKGIEVRIAGGSAGTTYRIEAIAATSSSNTRVGDVLLKVLT